MTREEERQQAAKDYCHNLISEGAFGEFMAHKAGSEWADRTMIDKVYDWLEFYLAWAVVEWDEGITKQSFLDDLMRKMKGGEG